MSRNNGKALLVAILLTSSAGTAEVFSATASTNVSVQRLRCEYLSNPSGIDAEKPRLNWMVNGPGVRGQSAYRILAASTPEILRKDQGDLWDSGRVQSSETTWIDYGGKALGSGERVYWKVRVWSTGGEASAWSAPATWSMGLLQPSDWHAKWIGERRPEGVAEGTPLPFPWLRKTFTLAGKPRRAVAYVNPLGYYELYINGKKVDDQVLSPAVSDYSKRSIYVAHEVADYLVPGKNVIALWLGRGWYVKGHPGVVYDGPLVRAQLEVSAADGNTTEVVTDETWKARESPITPLGRGTAFGDYGGERFDARLQLAGWNGIALDDPGWRAAEVFDPPQVVTSAQMVEPNRLLETIHAVGVQAYPKGGWVIDMGRDFTGWLEMKLPAIPSGSTVKLEYSDQMEPDKPAPSVPAAWGVPAEPPRRAPAAARAQGGDKMPPEVVEFLRRRGTGNPTDFPNTANQRDEVVGNGEAVIFRSRFNYHGFRYVRVIGLEKAPAVSDAKGYSIRTSYDRAGEFTSSNELLNQIYKMVTWTYESLTLGGYVVDCPTRERLGYGGDAGTSFETGMYNFSTGGLYNRWLSNWRDAQDASGSLPHTAPNYPNQGGGGPMWGGIVVTLPWQMYLQYGDKAVLETNYPTMRKWLAYQEGETKGDLLLDHKSHAMQMQMWNFLGDWLTPKGNFTGSNADPRPAQLINSEYLVYELQLASKIARTLGKDDDAAGYSTEAEAVAKAIQQHFYNADEHDYLNGDSVLQAFPLLTGVTPPELRASVRDSLENTIRVRNEGRFDTGMDGTYFLMKYLMQADRSDLIYLMTDTRAYPGWGYMLANGATTSWEGWTGGSHIHDTLISIGAWFIEGLGGIRSDGMSPGFEHFIVKPAVVGDLTFVKAKYNSIHGDIASDWRIEDGTFKLRVTVPPGTTATVFVPGSGPVRTNAKPSKEARSFEAEAGAYLFETAM